MTHDVPKMEETKATNLQTLSCGRIVRHAYIVEPTQAMNSKGYTVFEWPMVELRQMSYGGMGVFATKPIFAGATFPHIGTTLREPDGIHPSDSHAWTYEKVHLPEMAGWRVDGRPTSMFPHKGIGTFGLAMTMLVNEETDEKHTCVFSANSLMVAVDLEAGDQLTAYYGKDYENIRQKQKYSVSNNKNLQHHYELIDAKEQFQGFQPDYVQRAIMKWHFYIKNLEFEQFFCAVSNKRCKKRPKLL
jgi:hypothetical protein